MNGWIVRKMTTWKDMYWFFTTLLYMYISSARYQVDRLMDRLMNRYMGIGQINRMIESIKKRFKKKNGKV
jgi:hypothetical protein